MMSDFASIPNIFIYVYFITIGICVLTSLLILYNRDVARQFEVWTRGDFIRNVLSGLFPIVNFAMMLKIIEVAVNAILNSQFLKDPLHKEKR